MPRLILGWSSSFTFFLNLAKGKTTVIHPPIHVKGYEPQMSFFKFCLHIQNKGYSCNWFLQDFANVMQINDTYSCNTKLFSVICNYLKAWQKEYNQNRVVHGIHCICGLDFALDNIFFKIGLFQSQPFTSLTL